MLQLLCLSNLGSLDAGVADCDGSCGLDGGGPCLLHSGLCCPTDKLDGTPVIEFINDEELLEDLAIAASLPPSGTELLLPTAERGWCQGVSSAGGAPRLPVRSLLSSSDNSSWTARHRMYSSSSVAEPPPRTPSPPPASRLVVPRRKRDMSVMRGRRPWSMDMPSIPTPHAANPSSSGDSGVRQESRLVSRPPRNRRRVQRACSHCDSTETPQWRAGPDGPGTLCNACGLRYSLNKLLPEYRPSTSPSFQSDKHSNRHRKVVKLRERNAKDTVVSTPPAPPAGDSGEFMDVLYCKYSFRAPGR